MNERENPAAGFDLESFLPYRLSLLSNTVSQGISSAYREDHGLSVTQWRVVAVLGRFPGLTATEIMERTAMDKVAISRAVKKLLQAGILERSPHQEDRRRLPLKLTVRKGMPLFRDVVPKAVRFEQKLLAVLNDAELKRFDQLVRKLQASASRLNRDATAD